MEPKLNRPVLPVVIAGVAGIVLLGLVLWALWVLAGIADQGRQVHDAMCVYKASLVQDRDASLDYLAMTPAERHAKYPGIDKIPDATIRESLRKQEARIKSLRLLHCD